MKEQNKPAENKAEITNLTDAEFKTLVLMMLKELTEYGNNTKKTQEDPGWCGSVDGAPT